ncbi:MAG: NADH-quinone oxidoreductase subunit N [Deltaproteobacteria bacterium]|nr:NADH-quinone oxidoreductase subunit N [Deltaproteobacteria bacterium]
MNPVVQMSTTFALLPLVILAASGVALLLLEVFGSGERREYLGYLAIAGAVSAGLAMVGITVSAGGGATFFDGAMVVDRFASFVGVGVLAFLVFAVLLSVDYLREHQIARGEYYALLFFAAAGMLVVASAGDFIVLFLGIELLSLSIYVLAGYWRSTDLSVEASIKYFLLGSFASAILLFGIVLIWGEAGTLSFAALKSAAAGGAVWQNTAFVVGVFLVLGGIAFKVAAVPFHMWTPDAYQGAPTSVTAFMGAAVKLAGFAALVRVFPMSFGGGAGAMWVEPVVVLALITMTVGNLAALTQSNVKRLFAYSSIAHAGYVLAGVAVAGLVLGKGDGAASRDALAGVLFYLATYGLTFLGAIGVVILLGRRGDENLTLDAWSGFGWQAPAAGIAITVFLMSLGGIPPTAGFFAKFYLLRATIEGAGVQGAASGTLYTLAIFIALNSLIALGYYLKLIIFLYMRRPEKELTPTRLPVVSIAVVLLVFLVLALGVLPGRLYDFGYSAFAALR